MSTATAVTPRLSAAQVDDYRREGYLLYKQPVLPAHKFAGLKNYFEEMLSAWPSDKRPEGMDVPHFTHPALFEWLFADEVLDLIEPILGPDIALFSSHFICKPKGDGKRVPWHEDSAYWRDMVQPMEVCTLWLAIDPSTPANGGMYVIPRTHGNGYSDYNPVDPAKNVFSTEIKPEQRDDAKAVAMDLQPNECSLHNGRLMHGSPANTSDIRRCGYTMRYISAGTRFNREKHGHYHQIYLARGKDRAGNTYGDPTTIAGGLMESRVKYGKKGH
ncbi:MAG TPA: phytanoyl-CoA dioxygenase family protein [Planctomycetota bacterium]|nr:phytanoyl-CoA dioxygenase family protein [Planctomycetota bacterium]